MSDVEVVAVDYCSCLLLRYLNSSSDLIVKYVPVHSRQISVPPRRDPNILLLWTLVLQDPVKEPKVLNNNCIWLSFFLYFYKNKV